MTYEEAEEEARAFVWNAISGRDELATITARQAIVLETMLAIYIETHMELKRP